MERVDVYCCGKCCGEAIMKEDGVRVEICTQIDDPGDGLYRAILEGERGQLSLGVMEPENGRLTLRRRPEWCEVERLGMVRCVRVGCAFAFGQKKVWNETNEPSSLLRSEFLRSRLSSQRAWWRRGNDGFTLALPLRSDAPFPLETLFCFACVERVEGELCVVYRFDADENPVVREKT